MQSTALRTVGQTVAGHATAVVFVVPGGSVDARSGTGQRTAILFEALKLMGPVTVVILAEQAFTGAEKLFPGASDVMSVASPAMSRPPRNAALRAGLAILRFLAPGRVFAPQHGLGHVVSGIFDNSGNGSGEPSIRIVATRYARTFALTGLRNGTPHGVVYCVDVDDRDDQKIDHQIMMRIGKLPGRMFGSVWKPRFLRTLKATLAQASVVLLAKGSDRFADLSVPQVVVPNVPFRSPEATALSDASSTSETLLFVGIASHRPNLNGVTWFLRACWPAIRAARPAATIRIVGLGDWSALPSDLTDLPGVQVVGLVDDLAPEYARARAAICPILEGAGSQIKVIEACAHARPVVSTAFASGGFGPEIERSLSVASDPVGFAQACIDLLADPERAARQGAALRALQQATHSRAAVENLIVTTLTDLVASARLPRKVPS